MDDQQWADAVAKAHADVWDDSIRTAAALADMSDEEALRHIVRHQYAYDEVDEILERWASAWVHWMGQCSNQCHGTGARKEPDKHPLEELPPGAFRLPADDRVTWATRAIECAGLRVFWDPQKRRSFGVDTSAGYWCWGRR